MQKIDEILDLLRKNDLIAQKLAPKFAPKKKSNTVLWVLGVVGAVLAIAAVAYGLYRYFKPDDFFEDEESDETEDAGKESAEETGDYSEQE